LSQGGSRAVVVDLRVGNRVAVYAKSAFAGSKCMNRIRTDEGRFCIDSHGFQSVGLRVRIVDSPICLSTNY